MTTTEQPEKVEIPKTSTRPQSSNTTAGKHAKVTQFLEEMPSVSGVDVFYNMSIFGPPGSGKTTFACGIARCIADDKYVLYVDVENSHVALLNKDNPVYPYLEKIKGPYRPKNFEELYQICETLAETEHQFEAIIVDTVGEVAADTVTEVLLKNVRQTSRNKYLSSEHEYRERNERLRRALKLLRDMPIHVILISHEAHPDPEHGRLSYSPALSETVRGIVQANCDIQIRTQGVLTDKGFEGLVEIMTSGTANVELKTRIMGLPAKLKNPKMEHIFAVQKPTKE